MSNLRFQPPVIHTPSFREYRLYAPLMRRQLTNLHVSVPMGMLDTYYYFTNMEGWGKVLEDLIFKSDLYKEDKFDCDNYALRAMNLCAERYGLNTLMFVIGQSCYGKHAFNMFYDGKDFMLWEPNGGFPFAGSPFEIGEYDYIPEIVLL